MSGVSTPNRAENTSQERPAGVEPFSQALTRHGYELTRAQINTGLACNHCCRHCHLDAGPARWEMMDLETMQPVVDLACRHRFAVIDITGGAPELNEHLGFMVEQLAPWTPRIMLRSSLTAISTTGRKSLIDHEEHFRTVLQKKWGIVFNHLCSFSNVPLGRFRQWLLHSGNLEAYLQKLAASFNPCAVDGLMCRTLLSVSWDGLLYDCDFNLANGLFIGGRRTHLSELKGLPAPGAPIAVADHCYACTAGAGFT